jgi:hypothetical protein
MTVGSKVGARRYIRCFHRGRSISPFDGASIVKKVHLQFDVNIQHVQITLRVVKNVVKSSQVVCVYEIRCPFNEQANIVN